MRILHVIKSLNRGGAEVMLKETVRLQRARGDVVDVAVFTDEGAQVLPEIEALGVRVHVLHARTAPAMFLAVEPLRALVARLRVDVMHAHLPLAGVVARLAGGAPVVYSEHNVFESYHPLTQLAARATWGLQRAVVAVSDEVARSAPPEARTGVPVVVVKNGIDVDAFAGVDRAAARAALGVDVDDVVVGTVAVFRPAKQLVRWVAAVDAAIERAPRLRAFIVGYGPLQADVEAAVAHARHRARITLLGPRDRVHDFLGGVDIYVMTSSHEGLPVALLEAMAAGSCPVSTPVGGIPEVVDAASGVLVDGDVVAGVADTLVALADDGARRARLAAAARAVVAARFSIAATVAQLDDVYARARSR
jgi:glycosyltransferase involved in cell wall biosynthesis